MNITVTVGPVAVKVGRYWQAVCSGTRWLPRRFRTADAALAWGWKHE